VILRPKEYTHQNSFAGNTDTVSGGFAYVTSGTLAGVMTSSLGRVAQPLIENSIHTRVFNVSLLRWGSPTVLPHLVTAQRGMNIETSNSLLRDVRKRRLSKIDLSRTAVIRLTSIREVPGSYLNLGVLSCLSSVLLTKFGVSL
jgi:hypothetical protein